MKDMIPSDVSKSGTTIRHKYYNGFERTLIFTDIETSFPEGNLIVSRTDIDGNIIGCNKAFCDMSGFTKEELIGQPHCILRHPDMPAAAFKDLWNTVEQGKHWHGYVKNLRKDGGYYWVYATVIPNVREGKRIGFSSIRRQPSRVKIQEHIALYKKMKAQEA
ncbi:MAG: PAS domain-containing protein [Bacteriovoracaceae bacterium]|nr:PAS domain-containing protein [Bacteroidota bacterium]